MFFHLWDESMNECFKGKERIWKVLNQSLSPGRSRVGEPPLFTFQDTVGKTSMRIYVY